jgi:hypothetical protein
VSVSDSGTHEVLSLRSRLNPTTATTPTIETSRIWPKNELELGEKLDPPEETDAPDVDELVLPVALVSFSIVGSVIFFGSEGGANVLDLKAATSEIGPQSK